MFKFFSSKDFKKKHTGLSENTSCLLCFVVIGPGPLNITFGSDMPITLLHLMLMSKIYVVNSVISKNVIGISDLNVMFKGPGPMRKSYFK